MLTICFYPEWVFGSQERLGSPSPPSPLHPSSLPFCHSQDHCWDVSFWMSKKLSNSTFPTSSGKIVRMGDKKKETIKATQTQDHKWWAIHDIVLEEAPPTLGRLLTICDEACTRSVAHLGAWAGSTALTHTWEYGTPRNTRSFSLFDTKNRSWKSISFYLGTFLWSSG